MADTGARDQHAGSCALNEKLSAIDFISAKPKCWRYASRQLVRGCNSRVGDEKKCRGVVFGVGAFETLNRYRRLESK